MGNVNLRLTHDEEADILKKGRSYVFKTTPQGRTGDTFSIDGRRFELIDVCERSMDSVSRQYHTMGGYSTPSDFDAAWKRGHSGKWTLKPNCTSTGLGTSPVR
jgi:hypothetical protein